MLVVALLLPQAAEAFDQEWIDSLAITNLTSDPQVVIAALGESHNRDTLDVRVETFHERLAGSPASASYTLEFSVLPVEGAFVHPILNENGEHGESYAEGFTVTLEEGTSDLVTTEVSLQLVEALDPNDRYRVRARMLEWVVTEEGGVHVERDLQTTAPQRYLHFANTDSGDAAFHVHGTLDQGAAPRLSLIETDPALDAIPIQVTYSLRRFDDWEDPIAAVPVGIDFEVTLFEASDPGTPIPLKPVTFAHPSRSIASHATLNPPTPAEQLLLTDTLQIEPADFVQLDPVNGSYTIRVRLRVESGPDQGYRDGGFLELAGLRILHFNGALRFGAVETEMTRVVNLPVPEGVAGANSIPSTVELGTGGAYVAGMPDHTLGPTTPLLVDLHDNGTAHVVAGVVPVTFQPAGPDNAVQQNVRVRRDAVTLGPLGGVADLRVTLPGGTGWTQDRWAKTLSPFLDFPAVPIGQGLLPFQTQTASGPFYVCEESRPLLFQCSDIQWNPTAGSFAFNEEAVLYVRGPELDHLDAVEPQLADSAWAIKRSNEQYYRFADTAGNLTTITAGPNGSGYLESDLVMEPGDFETHFPLGAYIEWLQPGELHIESDRIDPSRSRLAGCAEVQVLVDQGCGQQQSCGSGLGISRMVVQLQDEELRFTSAGGLHGGGTFRTFEGSSELQWGAIPNSDLFAHTVGPMGAAGFFLPGHLIGPDTLPWTIPAAPAVLLLSGVPTNDLTALELPGSAAYTNGLADYAGINLRIADNPTASATSHIGGDPVGPYLLTYRSKYYARRSGVTGIHEAQPDSFPTSLTLYGYDFTFSNYGLSYLSSANRESRTQGDVTLPYPSDFTQEFEELLFTCVGGLDKATIPAGAGSKDLGYWKATIDPYAMVFARNDACDPSEGWLTLGVSTQVAHIEEILSGVLGFEPGGDLISAANGVKGIDSRLSLPPTIDLAGPGDQVYPCTVATAAYFNDYSLSPDQVVGSGYVNLAGSLDLPFFENMPIHLRTSAEHNSASARIDLAGGWPTSGWTEAGTTYFSNQDFDASNRGLPAGVSLGDYWSDAEFYRPRARQSWLGVIDFDDPLAWTSATRMFRSFQPVGADVAVVVCERKIDFLTAEKTKLSFATKFDPVPIVSAFDTALTENLDQDIAQGAAFFKPLGTHVVNAIQAGQDAMEFVLADQPYRLFGPTLEDHTSPILRDLVTSLKWGAQTANPGEDYYTERVQGYVFGTGLFGQTYTLRDALGDLLETSGSTNGLIDRMDAALASVEWLIDAMVTNVTVNPISGEALPVGQEQAGILAQDPTNATSILLVRLLADFVGELKLVEDEIASMEGLQKKVAEQVKDKVIGLDTIRDTFEDVRADLVRLRARLAVNKDVRLELEQAMQGAALDAVATQVADKMIAFLQGVSANGQTADSFTDDQLVQTLGWDVQNAFYGSPIPAAIQAVLRRHVYDLDASVKHATGAVFSEANELLRDTVSALLVFADEGLVSLLGKVAPVAAAASLRGYSYINGDSLHELRIDGKFLLNLTTQFKTSFAGYLLIKQLDSEGDDGCGYQGGKATEVTLAADEAKMDVLGIEIAARIMGKFTFEPEPLEVLGLAGSFNLKKGKKMLLQGMGIEEYGAAIAFGEQENYFAGLMRGKFQDTTVAGGLFIGRSCTLDPFNTIDPRAADLLGEPPFTGFYAYVEGWVKVLEWGWLDVSAGIGYGVFGFAEGPVGGRMLLGVKVQFIKIISLTGEVMLVGVLDGLDPRLSGSGSLRGCLGYCPFCVCAKGELKITYKDDEFDVETDFDTD